MAQSAGRFGVRKPFPFAETPRRKPNVRILNRLTLAILPVVGHAGAMVLADGVRCPPGLGVVTIDGNVLVSAGGCTLAGTRVRGNVHQYGGGTLIARGARIDGNIQCDGANFVNFGQRASTATYSWTPAVHRRSCSTTP